MKYSTFAAIRKGLFIGAPIIALVLLFRSCTGCGSSTEPMMDRQQLQSQQSQGQLSQPQQNIIAKPRYGSQELPLTSIESEILQLQKDPLILGKEDDNGSIKRTVRKGSVKLDIRCDKHKGFTVWNRLKVDWDNNGKYDEKWSFRQDGSVARFVAPNDDEGYTLEYRLGDSMWRLK